MADVAAKREKAIADKEAKRKEENQKIKDDKARKQAEREAAKKKEDDEKTAEQKKKDEIQAKREKNVAEKEAKSKKGASSKYSKKDVMELKKVFDEYDKDRSGKITLAEFAAALKLKKAQSAPRPGEKSTLAQRKANEGIGILDLSESVFHEMDSDGDGEVEFGELLKLFYRYARPDEIETMLSYVAVAPEPEPEPKSELSKAAKKQINDIFKLYDKDKNGNLSYQELKKALEKTGFDNDEIKELFEGYDLDGDGLISKNEFETLMESTGAFAED